MADEKRPRIQIVDGKIVTAEEAAEQATQADPDVAELIQERGVILNDGTDGEEIEVQDPIPLRRKMSAAEKSKRAISLKLAGASYKEIAENLGYADPSGAQKVVSRGLRKSLQENAAELRRIHYSRLEHMLMIIWPDVNVGDAKSMNTALNVMDRMEKLYGLNAAEKVDITAGPRETVIVAEGGKDEYIESLKAAIEEEERDIVDAEVLREEAAKEVFDANRPEE